MVYISPINRAAGWDKRSLWRYWSQHFYLLRKRRKERSALLRERRRLHDIVQPFSPPTVSALERILGMPLHAPAQDGQAAISASMCPESAVAVTNQ